MNTPPDTPQAARTLALATEIRTLFGRLRRRLRDQSGAGNLTGSQVSVIVSLDRNGPSTVTTLARIEGMRPQSMGAIITALETLTLVSGAPDPADGRQTLWSLTPYCQDMLAAGRAAKDDWLFHAIDKNLTPEEQDKLTDALSLLKRIAES